MLTADIIYLETLSNSLRNVNINQVSINSTFSIQNSYSIVTLIIIVFRDM